MAELENPLIKEYTNVTTKDAYKLLKNLNLTQHLTRIEGSHLYHCNCQEDLISRVLEKKWITEKQQLLITKPDLCKEELVDRRAELRRSIISIITAESIQRTIPCKNEVKELKDFIWFFNERYPLTDSRAFLIIKSILRMILNAYRLSLECRTSGIVGEYERMNGDIQPYLNPTVHMSLKIEKEIIGAVLTLDKMFFGEKHVNENVNYNVNIRDKVYKDVVVTPMENVTEID